MDKMKPIKFNFKSHVDLTDLQIHVKISDYRPERPPPYALHPDHPDYDDSGEPEEYEYEFFIIHEKEEYPLPDFLYSEVCEMLKEEITEKAGDILGEDKNDR